VLIPHHHYHHRSLPDPDGHTFSLLLDAQGKKGLWEACVELMNQVNEKQDLSQVTMVYKTAIGEWLMSRHYNPVENRTSFKEKGWGGGGGGMVWGGG